MLLRRKRKPSLKVRELQEEDQVATKRHASKRHSESLQERQERLQRDAQAHASKRHSESLQERQIWRENKRKRTIGIEPPSLLLLLLTLGAHAQRGLQ